MNDRRRLVDTSRPSEEEGGGRSTLLEQWDSVEGFMGSVLAVALQPISRHVTNFLQAVDDQAMPA